MKELGCLKNNYNFYVVKLHFENPQCAIAHLRFFCLPSKNLILFQTCRFNFGKVKWIMKLTIAEIQSTKYVQIYLTEEELQKKDTKDLIKKYKQEKYSMAIFVTGKENYPEILGKIITKQVELNRNVC
mgnify:CR=1 FL=1